MQPLKRNVYDDLLALPDRLIGEILNGELYAHPRPRPHHALVATNLGTEIAAPYHRGKGGPGGWWILDEPEIHFQTGDVLVPDMAGWRRTRLPELPTDQHIAVAPDWVCEIASPSTASVDREIKMPIYAAHGVLDAWLINPVKRHLEAYSLDNGKWVLQGKFEQDDTVSIRPFELIQFVLATLWE